MMDIKQKFKVYCSTNINDTVNKGLIDSLVEDNKPLILEGVASSNSVDLDGDYMTNECLEDMKTQALGLNIFLDHEHTIDKIVGKVTDVIETSSDVFKIKFSVIPAYEWYISDFLENGINLGLSIGASVLDFEDTDTGWKINKVKLHEISIVGIPANWDTFGTVQTSKELGMVTAKCFNGACKQIIDNLDLQKDLVTTMKTYVDKEFEDGEDPDEDGVITEEEVIKLINEAIIEAKDQIITEIVSEYHLDGKELVNQNPPNTEETDTEPTNSSDDGNKEKDIDMEKEEIVELIKEHSLSEDMVKELIVDALKSLEEVEADVTEDAPIVKEEDVEVTKAKEDEEEDDEKEEDEEDEEEKSSEPETEKSIEVEEEPVEVETEKSSEPAIEKSSENIEVDVKETIDIEELKKSIKEELRAEVEAEVEAELLKSLSTERKPVAHEQPNIEEVEKEASGEKTVKKGNVMSAREMAEHLIQ